MRGDALTGEWVTAAAAAGPNRVVSPVGHPPPQSSAGHGACTHATTQQGKQDSCTCPQ